MRLSPEEFWIDMLKAVAAKGAMTIDAYPVEAWAVELGGTRLRLRFHDGDGTDQVVVDKEHIVEGTFMKQGSSTGQQSWAFETPKGSWILRNTVERVGLPVMLATDLDGLPGIFPDGTVGTFEGEEATNVTVDTHNLVVFKLVDGGPKLLFTVTSAKELADRLNR